MPTLNRWIKAGKLPTPKFINKQRYWTMADIEAATDKLMNNFPDQAA